MALRRRAGYSPYRDGITQSVLGKLMGCPVRAGWYLRGFSGRRFPAATTWGNITHDALELLSTHTEQPNEWLVRELVERLAHELMDAQATFWRPADVTNFHAMVPALIVTIQEYIAHWWDTDAEYTWEELEGEFDNGYTMAGGKYAGRTVRLKGKRDGVLLDKLGKRWLFETKTRGEVNPGNLVMTLQRDLQVNWYLFALLLEETPAVGVVYNVVKRTRLRLKKTESVGEYEARVRVQLREKPDEFFVRYRVTLPRLLLSAFGIAVEENIIPELLDWYHGGMNGHVFGRPCVDKYGPCEYIAACHDDDRSELKKRNTVFPELSAPHVQ